MFADPAKREAIPDPQDVETFVKSRLRWGERAGESERTLQLYRSLIALRQSDPVLKESTREGLSARAVDDCLVVERRQRDDRRILLMSFAPGPKPMPAEVRDRDARVLLSTDGTTELGELLAGGSAVILAIGF